MVDNFPTSFYVQLSFKVKLLIYNNFVNFLMETNDLVEE